MIFFEAIGGLKLENQTSAVLHYLFVNSETFRREFVEHIKGQFSPSELPRFSNGIVCQCEIGPKDVGRIDLLIEADNCLLAIENKLWAEFQPDQPTKYRPILEEHSEKKFNDRSCYRLLVVAPSQRKKEIKKHLKEQGATDCIVVYWQDIRKKMLKPAQQKGNKRVQVIAELLDEFIEQQISKYANLDFPQKKLIGSTAKITNQYQRDFLYAMQSTFSNFKLSRMGFGKDTYGGFYFRVSETSPSNWFGFHNSDEGTLLQLHADVDQSLDSQIKDWTFVDHEFEGRSLHFTFSPDSWPMTRNDWEALINPLLDFIRDSTDPDEELDNDQPLENR